MLARELMHAGVAEVDTSARRCAEYSSDASNYRIVPSAVVFPRAVDEIAATRDVCERLGVPITMRGGGTSIAGNAIGTGVIVDCSRHLATIGRMDPESRTVVVDPGVVLDDLQRHVARFDLRFGPEPSTHSRATVGGMIGNNACGSRALRYGRTSDNVVGLDILTGTGERLLTTSPPDASETLTSLRKLAAQNLAPIRTEFGRFPRQGSGYALEHLLPEKGFDVSRFLAGSEGTLALILGATLQLTSIPKHTVLYVLGYPDMPTAADDVTAIASCDPVAVEGLDSRLVDVVRAHSPGGVPDLPSGRAWLFVELGGENPDQLSTSERLLVQSSQPIALKKVNNGREAKQLWRIREDGAGLASRPTASRAWHAGWEDAAVPPARLGAYLRQFEQLVDEYGLIGYPYGHLADGCIHVRLDFQLSRDDGVHRFKSFLLEAADLVARYGGSMSGEHGDGRARSELLSRMYSPTAIGLFETVKGIFDPLDIFNPGVLARPAPLDIDLRARGVWLPLQNPGFAYEGDGGSFARAVHRCSGVGLCRAPQLGDDDVMCPSFVATRDEKDSTRGRARVLQEMVRIDGRIDRRSSEIRDALDLCLACKGCSTDCPTGTDMARYKSEVLYQHFKRRVRPWSHYTLGRLPTWASLASKSPRVINAVMHSRFGRLARRSAGVSEKRILPSFAKRTFTSWFDGRTSELGGTPVILWVDTFTEYFQPEIGIAAVTVLEAAGYSVVIPDKRLCCGLTYISTGQLSQAKHRIRRTVDLLRSMSEPSTPIVGLEPSCVATLRGDAKDLLGTATGDLPHVLTLLELLRRTSGFQPNLTGTSIVSQPHCHHRAVLEWEEDRAYLVSLGADVTSIPGCCGLAGNFGMERDHFDISMKVAQTALVPALERRPSQSAVVADGFSCRLQIRQLSSASALHTAELLARMV
jgi:FAD/FMN-containing dehydrogenase/Fe-S oxidoreductase